MNRIVWAVTLLLFIPGNNSATPSSTLLQDSSKNSTISEQAEKNAPVKTITCDWASGSGLDNTKMAEDNAVKLALYEAVVSGRGVVKAKQACATIEGDPLPVYAKAKGGKLKMTYDYSRGRWLRFRGLLKFFGGNSYTTRRVEIGYLDQGKFILLSGAAPDGRRLILRVRGKEYF